MQSKYNFKFIYLLSNIGSLNLWQPLLLLLIDDEPDIKYRASEVVMKMKFPQNEGKYLYISLIIFETFKS